MLSAFQAIPEGEDEEYDSDDNDGASNATSDDDETGLVALVGSSYQGRQIVSQRGGDSGGRRANGGDSRKYPVPVMERFDPTAECYLQAFSHFSYRYSKRSMLICDLQGVLSADVEGRKKDECEGVFELTDPVIHYKSRSGRRHVYGKTDFGKKGMHKFFETHLCNDVCVLLGLASRVRTGN